MSKYVCSNRIELEIKKGEFIQVRCRKCPGCIETRKMEWKNRMLLESHGKPYRPLFVTWTFRPRDYLDSRLYVLRETQKLYKRLRKHGFDIRYFTAIERGEKNGRLHAHSIIWSRELTKLPWHDLFWTLLNNWKLGGIKLKMVDTAGAFAYTAKYIVKEQITDTDYLTGEITKSRNYSYSNKPALGTAGIERWKYICDRMFHVEQGELPANWFNMQFLGQLVKVYVPSDTWKRYVNGKLRDANVSDFDYDLVNITDNYADIHTELNVIDYVEKWHEKNGNIL